MIFKSRFVPVFIFLLFQKNFSAALVIRKGFWKSSEIVHGRPAGNCPYQVQVLGILGNHTYNICSGAIIDHRWILTVAHCVGKDPIKILAGSKTLLRAKSGRTYDVIKRVRHPNYHEHGISYHDIALLKVDRWIEFDHNHVEAIDFRQKIDVHEGLILRIAGWGKSERKGFNEMMETLMKVENNTACRIKGYPNLTKNHICATPLLQGSMDCQGDSGGPFTDINRKLLVGLVSFGYDANCPSDLPAVYTKVSPYVPWITQVINQNDSHHIKNSFSTRKPNDL